jgi:hypothetical protein
MSTIVDFVSCIPEALLHHADLVPEAEFRALPAACGLLLADCEQFLSAGARRAAEDLTLLFGAASSSPTVSAAMQAANGTGAKKLSWIDAPVVCMARGYASLRPTEAQLRRIASAAVRGYTEITVRDDRDGRAMRAGSLYPVPRATNVSVSIMLPGPQALPNRMADMLPLIVDTLSYDKATCTLTARCHFFHGCLLQLYIVRKWMRNPQLTVGQLQDMHEHLYPVILADYVACMAKIRKDPALARQQDVLGGHCGNRTLTNLEVAVFDHTQQ